MQPRQPSTQMSSSGAAPESKQAGQLPSLPQGRCSREVTGLPPGAADTTRDVSRVVADRHVGRHEGGGPPPQSDARQPRVVCSGPAGITGTSSPGNPGVGSGRATEAPVGLRSSGGSRADPVPWGLRSGIRTRRRPREGEPGETPPPKCVKDGGGRACPGPDGVVDTTASGRGRRGPESGKQEALTAT